MKLKKLLALLLCLTTVACVFGGCTAAPAAETEEPAATEDVAVADTAAPAAEESPAAETLTIGLSMYTLEYPFYVTMCDAFEAACKERGWECITTNASTDVSTQLNDCMDLINKGIDALVLTSWYGDSLAEVFDACASKNIPVFLMDTSTIPEGATFVTRIGTVNHDATFVGGVYAGKYFIAQGLTSVDAIALDSGDEVSTDRKNGFIDGMTSVGLNVNVINEYFSASREESMANMEDALTTYAKIDLVIATSAQHSLGAYSACDGAKRTDMKIISMDGEDEEKQMIDKENSIFLLTVTQDPAGMSQTIAQNVADYIFNKATFEQFQSAPAGVYCAEGSLTADQVNAK
ncbi:MAG: substrate-binding domain-containing protein [Eubacteriales bacterium]|nr:substrate-binding domain-containing protein [Eubacteriales bacterium]